MIVAIDYDLGNLASVQRAINYLGEKVIISDKYEDIVNAERLILPGVGAFGMGMSNLNRKQLIEPIKRFAESGRPLLGICLGAQLLLSTSPELGAFQGLDIIKGQVLRLNTSDKVPNIGWCELKQSAQQDNLKDNIFNDLKSGACMYFNHSYYIAPDQVENVIATSEYGGMEFCSIVGHENIIGCQFHPEKSGILGLQLFGNFLKL